MSEFIKKDFIEEDIFKELYEIHSNGQLYSIESESYLQNANATTTVQMSITLKGKTYRYNYLTMMDKYFPDQIRYLYYEKPKLNLDVSYYELARKTDNKDYSLNNLYWKIRDSAIIVYDLEGNFLSTYAHREEFFKDLEPLMDRNRKSISSYISNNQVNNSILSFQIRNIQDGHSERLLMSIGSVWNIINANVEIPVAKYYKSKLISIYKSITEASKKNNIEKSQISRNLNIREVNGFMFKTIE